MIAQCGEPVPGVPGPPGWRGMARTGGLSPGPGSSQHANIVTVGQRERERETGAASECLQTSTGRDRHCECSVYTDHTLLKAG